MDEVTERIREAVELRLEVEGAPEQVSNSPASSESALQHEPKSANFRARLGSGAGEGRFRCGPHLGQPS
jgi:hypothetical protein